MPGTIGKLLAEAEPRFRSSQKPPPLRRSQTAIMFALFHPAPSNTTQRQCWPSAAALAGSSQSVNWTSRKPLFGVRPRKTSAPAVAKCRVCPPSATAVLSDPPAVVQ